MATVVPALKRTIRRQELRAIVPLYGSIRHSNRCNNIQALLKAIGRDQLPPKCCPIPEYPYGTLPHSHSMISCHRRALNYQRKSLLRTAKHRRPDPSEICALEFKGKFRRFGVCSISTTIEINRSILCVLRRDPCDRISKKNTVSITRTRDAHSARHGSAVKREGLRIRPGRRRASYLAQPHGTPRSDL